MRHNSCSVRAKGGNQLCGKDSVRGHRGGEGLDDRTSPHCAYPLHTARKMA